MESQWHEIWGRYMDNVLTVVVGLPESVAESIETAMKMDYHNILLTKFYTWQFRMGYWYRRS